MSNDIGDDAGYAEVLHPGDSGLWGIQSLNYSQFPTKVASKVKAPFASRLWDAVYPRVSG